MLRRSLLPSMATVFLALAGGTAHAEGLALHAVSAPEEVRIDGLLREWNSPETDLKYDLEGNPSADDLAGRAFVSYDKDFLYVGAEIQDDKIVAAGDHVELLLGIPGGTVKSVLLYPGVAGKARAEAKHKGARVAGAEVVEAPLDGGGYSLEAKIPWSTFPEARTIRIGFRGAIIAHDADASTSIEASVSTAASKNYAELPPLSTEAELALGAGLLREKRIWDAPVYNMMADVVGDAMSERIMVYGRYLVVMGPTYRNGNEYFYRDMVSDAKKGEVPKLELKDVTGDGKADLLIGRFDADGAHFEVLSFAGGETPDTLLNDAAPGRTIAATVSSGRGATRITVTADSGARVFELKNGRFEVVDDKRGAPSPVPAAPRPGPTPAPPRPAPAPAPAPAADLDAVYALYKKERSVSGAARFDLKANLAGDGQNERVVVHDRDLVAFGPGFREGRAYAAVTMSSFARAEDIQSVKTRDVTGDGIAEVLVEGVVRSPLPDALGSGEVTRTVLLVYKLDNPFRRIFAAETARSFGKGSVKSSVRFNSGEIELAAGNASGFDAKSYPFSQDQGPNGGFEPLILPWSNFGPLRYRWDGNAFVR